MIRICFGGFRRLSLLFARVSARSTDQAARPLQRQRSKHALECVPNAAAGASACFSCSVGRYANASGDWRHLSTVTVDGLLMNAARLGVRWLYLDFMALDQLLAKQAERSAEAHLKHALRSHARFVLIGVSCVLS